MSDSLSHIKKIHELAAGIDGKMILASYGEDIPSRIMHFKVGDYEVMARHAEQWSKEPGRNVYMPLVVMRPDLPAGAKGGEKDVVATLGFVIDFDGGRGKDWSGRLPDSIEPQYVLETSPDNAQCFLFFENPVIIKSEYDRNTTKNTLKKLTSSCKEADPSGAELSHIWRIPGLNNWPNKKKINEGRDPNPCTVTVIKEWDGSFIALSDIEALLEHKEQVNLKEHKPIGHPDLMARDFEVLVSALQAIPNDLKYGEWIRLAHAFKGGVGGSEDYYPVFEEWSLQWLDNTPKIVRKKWDSIKYAEAGAGTIFHEAKKRGWKFPNIFNRKSPYKTADTILDNCFSCEGEKTLVYTQDFYLWKDGYYQATHEDQVKKTVSEELENAQQFDKDSERKTPFNPKKNDIAEVLEAIKNKTLVSFESGKTPPFWIRNDPGLKPSEILCVKNGLLHIPSRTLIPHTSDFFTVNGLPYEYDPNEPPPEQWLKFLQSIWPDDPESIECLQMWMGYLLTSDTSQHKILMITGPARSGKGTISRIIVMLLGKNNVVSPQIASFKDFGLQPLIDKTAAMINDARPPKGGEGARSIVETLLNVSGGDSMSIPRKYKENWNGYLPARFVLFSNEIPSSLKDPSQALANRLIHIKMTKTFLGREDRDLSDKLQTEISGILNWSLEGYDKMKKRGKFTQPESGKDALDYLKESSNPLASFLSNCCIIKPDASILTEDLREAYTFYSGDKEMSPQDFGTYLLALCPTVANVRKGRGYTYIGIGLDDDPVSEFLSGKTTVSLDKMVQ